MNYLIVIIWLTGLLFFTGGSVGIIRFPDFYARLHPAGKLDTAGQLLTMSAIALYVLQDFSLHTLLTATKIVLIVVIAYITGPTATHAIVDAGVRAVIKPWSKPERES